MCTAEICEHSRVQFLVKCHALVRSCLQGALQGHHLHSITNPGVFTSHLSGKLEWVDEGHTLPLWMASLKQHTFSGAEDCDCEWYSQYHLEEVTNQVIIPVVGWQQPTKLLIPFLAGHYSDENTALLPVAMAMADCTSLRMSPPESQLAAPQLTCSGAPRKDIRVSGMSWLSTVALESPGMMARLAGIHSTIKN